MAIAMSSVSARAEAWYVPGWMRAREPEGGAWRSFTECFASSDCSFRPWDGDRIWQRAVANADAEAARLAAELEAMDGSRRAGLTLVGHSLGGRIVVRALARLGASGKRVEQGIVLAPAIPQDDPDVARMGAGSSLPFVVVANPSDVTLKYVYAVAGGEGAPALGTDGSVRPPPNVVEFACPKSITDETEIADAWGRSAAVKRIANHHASFYFAELARILDGRPSPDAQTMVPQDLVNLERRVADKGVWWDVAESAGGWKLERHILTGHCRILDPGRRRVAWGREAAMRRSFAKILRQIGGPTDGR